MALINDATGATILYPESINSHHAIIAVQETAGVPYKQKFRRGSEITEFHVKNSLDFMEADDAIKDMYHRLEEVTRRRR